MLTNQNFSKLKNLDKTEILVKHRNFGRKFDSKLENLVKSEIFVKHGIIRRNSKLCSKIEMIV